MSGRAEFEAWAPPEVRWSAWAKPTLFVHPPPPTVTTSAAAALRGPPEPAGARPTSDELGWPRALPKHSAVVLEMPGALAVSTGIALRDKGYWPVPLFNATPGPNPFVDVAPIIRALKEGASALGGGRDARVLPCFLLDVDRCPPGLRSSPGRYDNRSVVFPQDFPSATLMRAEGIEQVVVVVHTPAGSGAAPEFARDLAHVLYGWQGDGLRIMRTSATSTAAPTGVEVPKPSGFGLAWRRILMFAGLRRSGAGGFGSLIPEASTGGGYS